MNSSSSSKLFTGLILLAFAVFVVVDILASGKNAIGQVYFYVLVGSGLFGLLSPARGIIYLLFLTGYLDYFKRLMILDTGMSQKDLITILGIAPVTMAGIILGTMARGSRDDSSGKKVGKLFFSTMAVALVGGAVSILTDPSGVRSAASAANLVVYIPLIALIPWYFPEPSDVQRLLRTLVIIYIPAASYVIYHAIYGITSWELAYLKSGFTIEIRQLWEKRTNFGTLNSVGTASTLFGVFAILVLLAPWKYDFKWNNLRGAGAWRIPVFLLFVAACLLPLSRTGIVLGLLGFPFCYFVFQRRILTQAFYVVGIAGLAVLASFSNYIVRNGLLNDVDRWLLQNSKSATMDRAFVTATISDRLIGFGNLWSNSKVWVPFGWKMSGRKASDKPFSHDALTSKLIDFGYIPTGLAVIVFAISLYHMHAMILSFRPRSMEKRCATCVAAAFYSLLLGCIPSPAQLQLFPVNTFMYIFAGVFMSLSFYFKSRIEAEEPEPEKAPAFDLASRRMPSPGHRFNPSRAI